MRPNEEAQTTENPTVYRRLYKRLVAHCAFCRWQGRRMYQLLKWHIMCEILLENQYTQNFAL